MFLRLGVDINYQNQREETALFAALYADQLESFKWLLSKNADPTIKNKKGKSVIDLIDLPDKKSFAEAVRSATKKGLSESASP